MKTTINKFKSTAIIFICLLSFNKTFAKVKLSGFRVRTNTTASGLGANVCLATDFKLGQGTFSIGPNFQTRRFNLSGFQCIYTYYVNDVCAKKRIYFFGNAVYNFAAYLSKGSIDREKFVCPETCVDYYAMKLSTVELHGGFGLKINHTKHISTSWGIGMGVYHTLGDGDFFKQMYREKNSSTIFLNFALAYRFKSVKQHNINQ